MELKLEDGEVVEVKSKKELKDVPDSIFKKINSRSAGKHAMSKKNNRINKHVIMSPYKRITLSILIVVMAYGLSMCSDQTEPSDPIQKIEKVIAGKNVVVLNFWSIFCLPCLKELPAIASLHDEYKNDKNISINTIALNSENELKQFFTGDTTNTYGNIYKRLNLKISFPIIAFNKYNSNFISLALRLDYK